MLVLLGDAACSRHSLWCLAALLPARLPAQCQASGKLQVREQSFTGVKAMLRFP